MDPNEMLRRIRELVSLGKTETLTFEDSDELVATVNILDRWITDGGHLPTVWNASHPPF